jgi:hypothetical protein
VDASGNSSDIRLTTFLGEFDRDIIIQSPTSFQSYQVNLRSVVQGQQQAVVNAMLTRFDNPSQQVATALSAAQIAQARADFLARVASGTFFTYR